MSSTDSHQIDTDTRDTVNDPSPAPPHEEPSSARPGFLFVTCQCGAEAAVKTELATRWPDFHFAYSRPGFLTFKLPADHALAEDFSLGSVLARAYGYSLGRAQGTTINERAEGVWRLAGAHPYKALHVWQRDTDRPGEEGALGATPLAVAAREAILRYGKSSAVNSNLAQRLSAATTTGDEERSRATSAVAIIGGHTVDADIDSDAIGRTDQTTVHDKPAKRGQLVLDCIVVDEGEWWVGYHRANSRLSRWPGGIRPIPVPADCVSWAYVKIEEALRWSRLPLKPGHRVVDLGCSPGGAAQALLDRGLLVTGIDPAEVDPRVAAHPAFTHVRKRAKDVRRREFRKMKWLIADMSVAPEYTLTTVEKIVTHREVNLRGLLLTLKLSDWKLVQEIPGYLERIQSWGFEEVRARQLPRFRQEICVAALRRRAPRKRKR